MKNILKFHHKKAKSTIESDFGRFKFYDGHSGPFSPLAPKFLLKKNRATGENFLRAENAQKITIFVEKMEKFGEKLGNFGHFW